MKKNYIRTSQGYEEHSICQSLKCIYDHPDMGLVKKQSVSTPTAELIAAEDWVEYIPPVIPPQPQTEPSIEDIARQLLKLDSIGRDVVALDDESALQLKSLFPAWVEQIGKTCTAGERYYYDERLWRCEQTHTAQDDWTPPTVPALFTEVFVEEWPQWVQPTGAQDAYNRGDKVTFEDAHYISIIDANVYSPSEYPAGWATPEQWEQLNS